MSENKRLRRRSRSLLEEYNSEIQELINFLRNKSLIDDTVATTIEKCDSAKVFNIMVFKNPRNFFPISTPI